MQTKSSIGCPRWFCKPEFLKLSHNHLMCHRIRIFPVPSVALGKKFGFEFLANMIDLIDEYHAHSFVKPKLPKN